MLVKDLYYVKLKMFGQIFGARCNEHYQIFAGICVRFCFGHKAPFSSKCKRRYSAYIFFFGRNIRFLHLEILRYLLLSKERIKKQKKTKNNNFIYNFTNLSVKKY